MIRPRLFLVTPAPAGSRHGNRTTAARWARILRDLGFRVAVSQSWDGTECDGLIALHARKSAGSIRRFSRAHPDRPIVLALTGTDLYLDLGRSAVARRSLQSADRLIVLHPAALDELPKSMHKKARVILQSFDPGVLQHDPHVSRNRTETEASRSFDVCVLAHLRKVKNPLLTARAARRLSADSQVRIMQIGGIAEAGYRQKLRAEMARNPRLVWSGNLPRPEALARLRRCHLLVNSSLVEGGANAVSEAIALGVPVLASHIPGNVGLLGESYPGYFPSGDVASLAALIQRCEDDPRFLRSLLRHINRLAPKFVPAREKRTWNRLLKEVGLSRA